MQASSSGKYSDIFQTEVGDGGEAAVRDEDLGLHQGGGGQPGEDLLEEVEEHRVAVLPRQLFVEAVFEVHGLSLVVASVEED